MGGEHYKEREVLIRIAKLEKTLNEKSSIIDRLSSKVNELENEIARVRTLRTTAINELSAKITAIEQQLREINSVPTNPPDKSQKDILLIGDSMIKHVDPANFTEREAEVACIPGARCDEVMRELKNKLEKMSISILCAMLARIQSPSMTPILSQTKS